MCWTESVYVLCVYTHLAALAAVLIQVYVAWPGRRFISFVNTDGVDVWEDVFFDGQEELLADDDVTVEDCEYSGVDEVRKWISAHQKSHKRR